jgi:O-antigen ligase
MDQALLTLFFFARPILFIDTRLVLGGINFFEFATIGFSFILALLALWHTVSGNTRSLSLAEWLAIAFIIWCTTTLVVYPESSNFKTYVKFVLPLLTYIALKRILSSHLQFLHLLRWMIVGFAVPVILSVVWTIFGRGVGQEIYWTGLVRYQGVYADIHSMGHCMGFLIMLCVMYFTLHKVHLKKSLSFSVCTAILGLSLLSLYCLYMSQTRTVYLGLLVFFLLFLLFYNRTQLVLFIGTIFIGAILLSPLISKIFYDVVDAAKGKKVEMAGSGRPYIWKHNLQIFKSLPIDRQLAGVGIGNTLVGDGEQFTERTKISIENVWNSHNDFLEVLMETGAVGLLLWISLTVVVLLTILKWEGPEKWVFLSFFVAVFLMNFLSNSYISRFGLAQMYFMVLSYFEIPRSRALSKDRIHLN